MDYKELWKPHTPADLAPWIPNSMTIVARCNHLKNKCRTTYVIGESPPYQSAVANGQLESLSSPPRAAQGLLKLRTTAKATACNRPGCGVLRNTMRHNISQHLGSSPTPAPAEGLLSSERRTSPGPNRTSDTPRKQLDSKVPMARGLLDPEANALQVLAKGTAAPRHFLAPQSARKPLSHNLTMPYLVAQLSLSPTR